MDARIQAILATYENNEDSDEGKSEEPPRSPSPPHNLEEFLQTLPEGVQEWPNSHDLDELENLNLTTETVGLGSLDDIRGDLSTYAPFDASLLDDVERQLEDLGLRFRVFSDYVLVEEDSKHGDLASTKEILSPTSKRVITTVHANDVINRKESTKQARFGLSDDPSNVSKSIQNTTYPGFFPTEMTVLPGQIEALQLLNNVIKAQNVMPGFSKILKKLFLSEASVAILQDTFWWFFLNQFKAGSRDSKKAQDGLFNRIADSFVALFFGVPTQYKDRFFSYYPDCFSQAVYSAYCQAFPRSYSLFDGDFKTNLLNTISEWMTGTKPPPQAWKQWNFKLLEPANIRDLQENTTESLKVDMSFDIDATLEDTEAAVSKSVKRLTIPQLSASRMIHTSKGSAESHQIGPGPEFERVHFNIFGQSPLVSHYLQMKDLTSGERPTVAVGRTEISKQQMQAPTYKQVLDETKRSSRSRSNNYQRVLDASNQESIRIQKQKLTALRKIDKLKTDLALKNQDIKIISEKLVDLVSQSDYGNTNSFAAKNVNLDDDDDDEDD